MVALFSNIDITFLAGNNATQKLRYLGNLYRPKLTTRTNTEHFFSLFQPPFALSAFINNGLTSIMSHERWEKGDAVYHQLNRRLLQMLIDKITRVSKNKFHFFFVFIAEHHQFDLKSEKYF